MTVLTPRNVYRRYETDGVPDSGAHDPIKAEIIQLLEEMRAAGINSVVRETRDQLLAVTPAADTYPLGMALGDSNVAYNGVYSWSGSAWVRERSFPDTLAVLTVTGGTGNAVQASARPGVDPSEVLIYLIQPGTTNSGSVTLSIGGSASKPVLDVNGDALAPGLWSAGRLIQLVDNGDEYRLVSDPDADGAATSAAQSASDAAEDAAAAELARIAAEAAASSAAGGGFSSITAAQAYAPASAPDFMRLEGYTAAGDGGGALYKKVVSQPSHAGKFSITLDDGVTVVWYEIAERIVNPKMFGAVGDGVTNDTVALQSALLISIPLELNKGAIFLVDETLDISTANKQVYFRGGTIKADAGFPDLRLIDITANGVELHGPGTVDGVGLPPLTTSFIGVTWEGFGIACQGASGSEYTGLYIGDGLTIRNCPGAAVGIEYVDDWEVNGVSAFSCDNGATYDGPGVYYINQVDRYTARNITARTFNWKGWNNSNGFDFTATQLKFKDGKNDQCAVFFKGCENFVGSEIQVTNAFGVKCDKSDWFTLSAITVDCANYGFGGLMVQAGSHYTVSGITVKDYTAYGIIHAGHPSTPATAVEKAVYTGFNISITGTPPVGSNAIEINSYTTATAMDVIFSDGYIHNCDIGISTNTVTGIHTDNVIFDRIIIDTFSSLGVSGMAKNTTLHGIKFRNGAASTSCIRLITGAQDNAEKYVISECEADAMAATVTFLNAATTSTTGVRVGMLDFSNNRMSGGLRLANVALNNAADFISSLKMNDNMSYDCNAAQAIQVSNPSSTVTPVPQIMMAGNILQTSAGGKKVINFVDTAASGKWNGVVANNYATVTNAPNNV